MCTYFCVFKDVVLRSGLTADANILIGQARTAAQQYRYRYQEFMPVEQLVQRVCNYKHAYTQFGGLRPFGVAFLFAGFDNQFGFQLYQSDPSGNYSGWKATVIGQNNQVDIRMRFHISLESPSPCTGWKKSVEERLHGICFCGRVP
jgi:20S proteasome alpha/beta subunit